MPEDKHITKPFLNNLQYGGEMGQLIRSYNWPSTGLGDPCDWPQSLLTTLSIMLNSRFPMFLWWGPHLIQFYNDAYRLSLGISGKHPKALGQKGKDCWKEIWPVISPMIDKVLSTGEATWNEDELIPIFRNNRLEDVYWTFSYSPVFDEGDKPAGILVICNETTDKIKSYNALESAKEKLEFAIEAAELGTWDLNPVTNSLICNSRLRKWFGMPDEKEMNLKNVVNIVADEDKERVREAVARALQKGSDGNYDIVYSINNPADSMKRVIKAKGKAYFDEEGNAIQFSGTLQDVTEDFKIQLRKDEFISVASHELKTPITTLSASMQILQKLIKTEQVSDKIRLFTGKASNHLNKLVHLLDDLLNVTKIQQGQLALSKHRFNLTELVQDCCEHIDQGNNYNILITAEAEVIVFADYRRIDQVLVNFINNAVKYSPQSKKIDIVVEYAGNEAKVSVRDYGIGINPKKLPHLFDRYYRVDELGHQFSGLGLGLYISADIIKRHNGKIGVGSEWGEGSTFWFTLPTE